MIKKKLKILGIIPARGGSKEIKRKNLLKIRGKTLIELAIRSAKRSKMLTRTIFSSEDKEILKVAKAAGAEVPFIRSAELSDDYTGTDEVFIHALNFLIETTQNYSYACCIYPAVPLLKVSLLSEGLDRLRENNATSCFPVSEFFSPIYRALEINDFGSSCHSSTSIFSNPSSLIID